MGIKYPAKGLCEPCTSKLNSQCAYASSRTPCGFSCWSAEAYDIRHIRHKIYSFPWPGCRSGLGWCCTNASGSHSTSATPSSASVTDTHSEGSMALSCAARTASGSRPERNQGLGNPSGLAIRKMVACDRDGRRFSFNRAWGLHERTRLANWFQAAWIVTHLILPKSRPFFLVACRPTSLHLGLVSAAGGPAASRGKGPFPSAARQFLNGFFWFL